MSAEIFLVLRLLLTGALYLFLGWGLWLLWQDLRQGGRVQQPGASQPVTLLLQADGQVEMQRFETSRIDIGRDPASHVRLDDPTISARHARLSYHHAQWWVEDLHSRNGTFINDVRLEEPQVILSGDVLRCGNLVFRVILAVDQTTTFGIEPGEQPEV